MKRKQKKKENNSQTTNFEGKKLRQSISPLYAECIEVLFMMVAEVYRRRKQVKQPTNSDTHTHTGIVDLKCHI